MNRTVLIAYDNYWYADSLIRYMKKESVDISICKYKPENIFAELEMHPAELLVMFPGYTHPVSYRQVIEKIRERYPDLKMIAAIYCEDPVVIKHLTDIPLVQVRSMPMNYHRLARIIKDAFEYGWDDPIPRIAEFLRDTGFREKCDGFIYLSHAVRLALDDPNVIKDMMISVYGALGEKFGVSASLIERQLRHLSKRAAEDGILPRMIGSDAAQKITNRELIRLMTQNFSLFYMKKTT